MCAKSRCNGCSNRSKVCFIPNTWVKAVQEMTVLVYNTVSLISLSIRAAEGTGSHAPRPRLKTTFHVLPPFLNNNPITFAAYRVYCVSMHLDAVADISFPLQHRITVQRFPTVDRATEMAMVLVTLAMMTTTMME